MKTKNILAEKQAKKVISSIASKSSHSKKRPNQNVRDTSKLALSQHIASGHYKTEVDYTYAVLKAIQPATRRMISEASQFPVNKISQYIKTLIERGLITELPEKKPCAISEKRAYWLIVVDQSKNDME